MADCIFCKLAHGEIPTTFVYEDDAVVAFRDMHPKAPVHVLIVPKTHVETIEALAAHENGQVIWGALLLAIPKVAAALGVSASGYRLINNFGRDGGQSVDHIHIHLLGGRNLGDRMV
ncbi:MAG: histidine triad nucleotide-binding protein [Eubacteriales bacterium]|nr:histidine triad nucleotide-binding protein [Eubacteriales bacterium]